MSKTSFHRQHRCRGRKRFALLQGSIVILLCASLLGGIFPTQPYYRAIAAEPAADSAAPLIQTSTITGSLFRDYDADGTKNGGEAFLLNVSGITVTAYNDNNTAVGNATVDTNTGQYTLNATGSGPFRLELSGLPDWLEQGAYGTGAGTSVHRNQEGTKRLHKMAPESYSSRLIFHVRYV